MIKILKSLDTLRERERERERELTFNEINNNKLNIDYNLKDSDKSLRN